MKKINLFFFLSTLLLGFTNISAQNKTANELKKVKEDLTKVFSKRDKSKETSGPQEGVEKKDTEPASSDKNASSKNTGNTNELKPGDVHPDAKYLDVDYLYHFNKGAAVIRKGSATALIDASGAFVVPFNKYRFTNTGYLGPKEQNTGIFPALEDGANGSMTEVFLNAKGKVIFAKKEFSTTFIWGRYLVSFKNSDQANFYDENGEFFTINSRYIWNLSEDLVLVSENSKYGFKNLKDEFVVKPIYRSAHPFSEGLACVGILNEFGQQQFGFINKKGEVVIPLAYSIAPSDFSDGLARVVPKDKSEFEYAFINKKNEIIIKHTKEDTKKHGPFYYFSNGISCNSRYVMDLTGKVVAANDFIGVSDNVLLQRANEQYSNGYFEGMSQVKALYDNGKIIFINSTMSARDSRAGFYDMFKKTIILPTFSLKNIPLFFDPVSGLAYANYYTGIDAQNKAVYREGYINEQGIFMIVKGPGSKW